MPRIPEDSRNEIHGLDYFNDFEEGYLWSYRIKATNPRKTILKILSTEEKPVTAQNLSKKCSEESPASIYRTLELFVQKGIVNVINTGSRVPSYELRYGRKHHHHVICTSCGEMEDIEDCELKGTERSIKTKKFSTIMHHSLEFFGKCKKCDN